MQASAASGGSVISNIVYDQVRNKMTVGFEFLGQLSVKNIDEAGPGAETRSISQRWERLQGLFETASRLPEAEWADFVGREVPDDPELRSELLDLLRFDPGNNTSPLTHALGAAIDAIGALEHLELRGLMAIPPPV